MKSHFELMDLVHASDAAESIPPVLLVVDDHADTLDMYDALLSGEGYWVARAETALEAFEYAQDLKPDAIITDIGLPGEMSGVDLIREVRADRWLQSTPIVAVTGREPRDLPSLSGVQFSALLLKPVAPGTLLARVATAVSQSSALKGPAHAPRPQAEPLVDGSRDKLAHLKPRIKNAHRHRVCPKCGKRLAWLETGRLGGAVYDYYRWCDNGCGLYCYDRERETFERLAEPDESH
jgi:CheY-like chemotaxis protein